MILDNESYLVTKLNSKGEEYTQNMLGSFLNVILRDSNSKVVSWKVNKG